MNTENQHTESGNSPPFDTSKGRECWDGTIIHYTPGEIPMSIHTCHPATRKHLESQGWLPSLELEFTEKYDGVNPAWLPRVLGDTPPPISELILPCWYVYVVPVTLEILKLAEALA